MGNSQTAIAWLQQMANLDEFAVSGPKTFETGQAYKLALQGHLEEWIDDLSNVPESRWRKGLKKVVKQYIDDIDKVKSSTRRERILDEFKTENPSSYKKYEELVANIGETKSITSDRKTVFKGFLKQIKEAEENKDKNKLTELNEKLLEERKKLTLRQAENIIAKRYERRGEATTPEKIREEAIRFSRRRGGVQSLTDAQLNNLFRRYYGARKKVLPAQSKDVVLARTTIVGRDDLPTETIKQAQKDYGDEFEETISQLQNERPWINRRFAQHEAVKILNTRERLDEYRKTRGNKEPDGLLMHRDAIIDKYRLRTGKRGPLELEDKENLLKQLSRGRMPSIARTARISPAQKILVENELRAEVREEKTLRDKWAKRTGAFKTLKPQKIRAGIQAVRSVRPELLGSTITFNQ